MRRNIIWVLILTVSFVLAHNARAFSLCEDVFVTRPRSESILEKLRPDRTKIHGVDPSLIEAFKERPSVKLQDNAAAAAKERYRLLFKRIFADEDISVLSKNKTKFFSKYNGSWGYVSWKAIHHVHIHSSIKKNPMFVLTHAHETQHSLDFHHGRLHQENSVSHLESEIRAFYREFITSRILFSAEELRFLIETEKDPAFNIYLEKDANVFIANRISNGYDELLLWAYKEDAQQRYVHGRWGYLSDKIGKLLEEEYGVPRRQDNTLEVPTSVSPGEALRPLE